MGFREEDHRSKVPSHHIMSREHVINMTYLSLMM